MKKSEWYRRIFFSINKVYIYCNPDINVLYNHSPSRMFKCSRLSEKEISELISFHDAHCVQWNYCFSAQDVKQRLEENHRCFIIRNLDEKIAGFCWEGINSVYSPDLNCVFKIDDRSIITYNIFFSPEFRLRGGIFNLFQYDYNKMSEDGYKKIYGYIKSDNITMQKVFQRMHPLSKIVGKIYYGYVFGYYVFIPLIGKEAGIKAELVISRWHRWLNPILKLTGGAKRIIK